MATTHCPNCDSEDISHGEFYCDVSCGNCSWKGNEEQLMGRNLPPIDFDNIVFTTVDLINKVEYKLHPDGTKEIVKSW